jgi:hypothetical protein
VAWYLVKHWDSFTLLIQKDVWHESVDWIHLSQCNILCSGLGNKEMRLRFL